MREASKFSDYRSVVVAPICMKLFKIVTIDVFSLFNCNEFLISVFDFWTLFIKRGNCTRTTSSINEQTKNK